MLLQSAAIIASLVVFLVCFVLAFNRDYHAGAIGTIGLAAVAVTAFSRCIELAEGASTNPRGTLLWIGLALFLGRLTFKFLLRRYGRRRIVNWRPS